MPLYAAIRFSKVRKKLYVIHSNGIVDEQYLRKTGDTLYAAGQRVIVRNADLLKLLDFIQEVVNGLLDAKPKESPTT